MSYQYGLQVVRAHLEVERSYLRHRQWVKTIYPIRRKKNKIKVKTETVVQRSKLNLKYNEMD